MITLISLQQPAAFGLPRGDQGEPLPPGDSKYPPGFAAAAAALAAFAAAELEASGMGRSVPVPFAPLQTDMREPRARGGGVGSSPRRHSGPGRHSLQEQPQAAATVWTPVRGGGMGYPHNDIVLASTAGGEGFRMVA